MVSAYFYDISSGDYTDAWNLLSPSMQSQGWGGNYTVIPAFQISRTYWSGAGAGAGAFGTAGTVT